MPYRRTGGFKISDHDIKSPLKDGLRACANCHPNSDERLRSQVFAIQDRTVSLMLRAGYGAAVVAKLFERVHREEAAGRVIDKALYARSKSLYEESLYRSIYMGAENSVGFHNPTEAGRILGDATAYASKAEGLLRQALAQAGVALPESPGLELGRYLNKRGAAGLMFKPAHEFRDPFGTQERLLPRGALGL